MYDSYFTRPAVAACCLWLAVFLLLVAAWVLRIISADLWNWSALLGLTAGVMAPMAGVAHTKVYAVRLSNLVRNTSEIPPMRQDIRSVR